MHRRVQRWCQRKILRHILTDPANALREQGFIDASFAAAKGGGAESVPTQRG